MSPSFCDLICERRKGGTLLSSSETGSDSTVVQDRACCTFEAEAGASGTLAADLAA